VVNMRKIMSSASLVLFLSISGFLLAKEEVVPPEVTASHVALQVDPLLETRYTEGARKRNLAAFGMPEPLVAKTIDRMRRIEERHTRKIQLLLEGAADPNALAMAMCGQTSQIRPRYSAMRFLVVEAQGRREAIRVSRATGVEEQDWAQLSPITDVYGKAELSDGREEDATLMAVAAILTAKEADLLAAHAPWGSGLMPGSWSWERVVDLHPGIEERVVEYFALLHLFVEQATSDGGICGEEEG